mgnify:CR=1 FL=1
MYIYGLLNSIVAVVCSTTSFVKVVQKSISVVVPKNIEAVRELLLQDREIAVNLNISGTNKELFALIPHNLTIALKKCSCQLVARNSNRGYTHISTNVMGLPRCTKPNERHSDTKHFESNGRLFFFGKTGLVSIIPIKQRKTINSERNLRRN